MKNLALVPLPKIQNSLEVLDALRKKIESGEVQGFMAAAITSEGTADGYIGLSKKFSRLEMTGAISELLFAFIHGDLNV